MTDALSSFGIQLKLGDGGDPENFTAIAELRDVGTEEALETEDATNHGSTDAWDEVIATIQTAGEVSMEVNYLPDDAGHEALIAAKRVRTLKNFQLVLPDDALTESFAAYVTKVSRPYPVKGVMRGSFTLRRSGAIS
jgi:predicted secreted protein